jgi:hypothetical protein
MEQDITPRETADSSKAQPKVWAFAFLGASFRRSAAGGRCVPARGAAPSEG